MFDNLDDYELEQAERAARLDAERVTWEFRSASTRRLDTGKRPITESPLFGGDAQAELFWLTPQK